MSDTILSDTRILGYDLQIVLPGFNSVARALVGKYSMVVQLLWAEGDNLLRKFRQACSARILGAFERCGEVLSGAFIALVGVPFRLWPAL